MNLCKALLHKASESKSLFISDHFLEEYISIHVIFGCQVYFDQDFIQS